MKINLVLNLDDADALLLSKATSLLNHQSPTHTLNALIKDELERLRVSVNNFEHHVLYNKI